MRWLAVLRVGVGLLFLEHGLQKLFGLRGGMGASGAHVPLGSLMGVAGVVEVVGGILVALGALTRPAAVVLALEMASALMVHLRRGGWPIQNGGELPLLYLLVFVFLAANGAGPVSLAALLDRRLGHARDTPRLGSLALAPPDATALASARRRRENRGLTESQRGGRP